MGQQKHLAYPAHTFEVSVAQVQVRDWRPLQCRNIAWHQRRVRFENSRDLDDGVCVALQGNTAGLVHLSSNSSLMHVTSGDIGAFTGMPLKELNMAGCGYDRSTRKSKITGIAHPSLGRRVGEGSKQHID